MSRGFNDGIRPPQITESRIEQLKRPLPGEKISSSHAWLRRLEELQPLSPEQYGDSLEAISPAEIRSRGEAEEYASSKLEEIIKPGLAGNLKVKVDLKLEDLLIFKNDRNVYVMCRDQSVAKKHLGNGSIEQVTFTDMNEVLGGGKYQIDIDPSQFSAFQKGSDVRVTPNEKFADENQGWRSMSKDELDLSKYFAERPSDSGTDKKESKKAIIDLGGPLWEKYKKNIDENGAIVAFGQFLSDVGGRDMENLLDDFSTLNGAFGEELSREGDLRSERYNEVYNEGFKSCSEQFENKLKLGKVDENEMTSIINDARKSLKEMKGILLEKGFELFIDEEGADIGSLYEKRKRIFDESSEEVKREIDRIDYHYQDYKIIRDKFLTRYFKYKETNKDGGEYSTEAAWLADSMESMEKKLEKSLSIVEWEAALEKKDIKLDFETLGEDELNRKFKAFIESKEGISTRRILADIKYLEKETIKDNEDYKGTIKDFEVHLKKFLNEYSSELDEKDKKAAINDLQGKLYSARVTLYREHFDAFLDNNLDEGKNTKKLEDDWLALHDDPNLSQELKAKVNLIDRTRYLPARNEFVRVSLELGIHDKKTKACLEEVELALNRMNEIMRKGIEETKTPEKKMREITKKYEEILNNNELHENLKTSLEGAEKDEIKELLQDIQGMHENIPEELYSKKSFREEYNEKIIPFIDSIGQFEGAVSDRDNKAEQVHSEAYDIRKFLSDEMFNVFVSKYQGEKYVKIERMFYKFAGSEEIDALSADGWNNVRTREAGNTSKRFIDERFELLKAKDGQAINDRFSRMAESARESLEVAIAQARSEVDDAASATSVDENEQKRIKNLQDLLKESKELLDSIEVTV